MMSHEPTLGPAEQTSEPRAIAMMQKSEHMVLKSKCGLCLPQSPSLSQGIMMVIPECFVGYKCFIEGVIEIN